MRAAAWPAGLLLAAGSAVAGCRAAGTDGVTPVPQLLAFLPWLLAPTVLALALALAARWWTGLVWGVLLLGLLTWSVRPYGPGTEPGGPALATFRVLTSNVEFGRGTGSLVDTVRAQRPAIVFVEECEHTCDAALRRALDYPYRQAVEAAGSSGSVVLSRYPLRPAAPLPGTMGMPGATADVAGHAVRLQLAHPMPPLPGQVGVWKRELGTLRTFAAAHADTPTILAGDFNASQDHAAFRRVLDTGLRDAARLAGRSRTPSWPARTAPALGAQIDHVLLSADFAVRGARFLDVADTDHRALLVEITLHRRS
ncbi:endonuclease/exonuclease/phosphatase family protein [Streptomyces sp. NPDC090106]|uniref:endonuclease/exonuclease/phosphatase family protein n=1 Tax=Streptomyces sp. NPDC090106 TaxID=3365946 RepID=UPI003823BDED